MTAIDNATSRPVERPVISLPVLPKPNPLLFALGSDKKRPILAHEHGNGSPCTVCKQACPGLDLHYWRKIWKACKCSKDNHDIRQVEDDPGKLRIGKLFYKAEPSLCSKGRLIAEKNGIERPMSDKFAMEKTKPRFAWVPPNVAENVIDKFMDKLPEQCRPIINSEGAIKRRLTIERQLPLHDYDPSACHRELTEEETKCMRKFVDYFKRESLGQGSIGQPDFEPSNPLMLPASLTCHKCKGTMERGDVAVFADRMGSETCECCRQKIDADVHRISYDKYHWHATPECFFCCNCKTSFLNGRYILKNGSIFCSVECKNKVSN